MLCYTVTYLYVGKSQDIMQIDNNRAKSIPRKFQTAERLSKYFYVHSDH